LVGFALLWLLALNIFAGEIWEFDLRTIERLGNELTRVSQTRDKRTGFPVSRFMSGSRTKVFGK